MLFCIFQPIHQDIFEKEPAYECVIRSGEVLKNSSDVQDDKDNIEYRLGEVKIRWTKLKGEARKRDDLLCEAVKATSKYQQLKDQFVPWLDDTEKSLEEITPCCNEKKLDEQIQKLKVIHVALPCFICFVPYYE